MTFIFKRYQSFNVMILEIFYKDQARILSDIDPIANLYEELLPGRIAFNIPIKFLKNTTLEKYMKDNKYFICYCRKIDRKHEFLHAMYFLSDEYRNLINSLWNSLSNVDQNKVNSILKSLGYEDKFIIDEFQAYVFTDGWKYFNVNKIDKSYIKIISKIERFIKKFDVKVTYMEI